MITATTIDPATTSAETPATAIAVDAETVVSDFFPDLSLRTWRRLDSSGKLPAGFMIGGRKLWRTADLRLWSETGFPDRQEFSRLREEQKCPRPVGG